jgi:hypothetical protein
MAVTVSAQDFIEGYVADVVEATETRNWPAVVQKWYEPDARLFFHHETEGKESSMRVWTFLLPTGENVPREVLQYPYKVENGRVYSWRVIQGGNIPRPIYNLQESQFDDRTLISEMVIRSAQEKPDVEIDPEAEKSRLGRIFLAFADTFNDFFATGDGNVFAEWLSDDCKMIVENELVGMGMVQHFARISEGSKVELQNWKPLADDKVYADISISRKGQLFGVMRSEFTLSPEGKIKESSLELESGDAVKRG